MGQPCVWLVWSFDIRVGERLRVIRETGGGLILCCETRLARRGRELFKHCSIFWTIPKPCQGLRFLGLYTWTNHAIIYHLETICRNKLIIHIYPILQWLQLCGYYSRNQISLIMQHHAYIMYNITQLYKNNKFVMTSHFCNCRMQTAMQKTAWLRPRYTLVSATQGWSQNFSMLLHNKGILEFITIHLAQNNAIAQQNIQTYVFFHIHIYLSIYLYLYIYIHLYLSRTDISAVEINDFGIDSKTSQCALESESILSQAV